MAGMADCLKEFGKVEATTSGGREFHSLIDLGKNEYVNDWILDCNCRQLLLCLLSALTWLERLISAGSLQLTMLW